MRQLLFLLLPTITLALIEVELTGNIHSGVVTSKANPHGFEEHVITEKERALFGIQNEGLKHAIEKINGKKPNEIYITSSTPYGDLHKRYGWKQLHVKIQPLSNKYFVDFSTDIEKLSKTKYENPNSRPKDAIINENGYLTNIIHSYWVNAIQIKGSAVDFTFDFNIEGHPAYFDKTLPFGGNRKYREKRYYETNATIRLEIGQKVTAELEASKGIIKVEIPYEVSLSGHVVAKYNEMYKDKYFFKFDINDVLKANNITTSYQMNQWLIYEVLYDTQLRVRDSKDIVLRSFPTEAKFNTKGLKKATNKHENKVEGVNMTRKKLEFNVPTDLGEIEVLDEDNDEESGETTEKQETLSKVENKT